MPDSYRDQLSSLVRPAAATSLLLLGVVVLLVAGSAVGKRQLVEANSRSALSIDPHHLDFGERDAQKDFHWTLPIRNRGPASVQVVALRTSCACSSVDPKSFELQPGEEISVTLRLDLTAS